MNNCDEARKAQDKFCEARGWPNFAELAAGQTMRCPACGWFIYGPGGYTVEQAESELITGCPFCGRSFVD